MKKQILMKTLGLSLLAATLLAGCGGSSTDTTRGGSTGTGNPGSGPQQDGTNHNEGGEGAYEGAESNIPYLRLNHANYKEHGSDQTPAPVKDANAKSINWTIAASSEEGAAKLAEHIQFMEARLKEGENPRAFDKLFLMEAYMKFNGYYTTSVEQSGTNVVVSKNANTACAYEVISAHSDAVSGDFFGRGDITQNYSATAESILASSACDDVRSSIETYIAQRQIGNR